MKLVQVAAAALNQTPLDWDGNRRNIMAVLDAAREAGVGILCLPELCISGYGCEDAFLAPGTHRLAREVLAELLPATRGLVVSLGLPIQHHRAVYNACALAADGRLLGLVAKRALAGDGIHYEPRWFKAWPAGKRARIALGGREVTLGDAYFDVGGVRIGFEICEDAWMAERAGGQLSLYGVDVILNPSASHFAFGKHELRRHLVLEGSRAFGVVYAYANLLGNEAGRAIYDGDAMVAVGGSLVAETRRFSYKDFELASATVDVELCRTRQASLWSYKPEVEDAADACVRADFVYPTPPNRSSAAWAAWEQSGELAHEELARAIALALFDYLRKSRAQGFVLSLSGGADSAAVACLVSLMVRFAHSELGREGLALRLQHCRALAECRDERDVTRALLTTLYQATRNSGVVTRGAARSVADALGARHFELDVEEQVQGYVRLLESALDRPLAWHTDDLALQNVQARARAPSAWLFANVAQSLLLSTSNRSEAAVGYATMDGDTAGGLCPIAGVDKSRIRSWLVWLERTGPNGLGPIPALRAVNAQAPTAELRPAAREQTDEDDLMPYPVLDELERGAIRDKRGPVELFEIVRGRFPEYAEGQLVGWIERFFRLFARNQWKRERYAPSFHVDDESLDPKTWYRFPILSGGFERELAELAKLVGRPA